MTTLELAARKKKRRVFSRSPSAKRPHRIARWLHTNATNFYHRVLHPSEVAFQSRRRQRKQRLLDEPMERIEIDEFTAKAIKLQVLDFLADQSGGTCSLLSMAHAVANSRTVLDCHAETRSIDMLLSHLSFAADSNKDDRRADFQHALRQIITRPSASTTRIASWAEAEDELSAVLAFPAETLNEDEADIQEGLAHYERLLRETRIKTIESEFKKKSHDHYRALGNAAIAPRIHELTGLDKADQQLAQELATEYAKRQERRKSKAAEDVQAQLDQKVREDEARERAASLMRPLSPEEREQIRQALFGVGSDTEVIAQEGSESIQRGSLRRLAPGQWLNDEVLSYFLLTLTKRDEEMCKQDPKRKRSHFFNSFFVTKLLNVGSSREGQYQYSNVKRWSKKVPGKDIFQLDKIVVPVNQGGMHWVCAVIFMEDKKIRFYDSMGDSGQEYLDALFQYVKDEHQEKKGVALPDEELWELLPCTRDVPRQRNGYDCGVFTCMFADFISKDCPLVFSQEHVTKCRERIALSILKGQAIM